MTDSVPLNLRRGLGIRQLTDVEHNHERRLLTFERRLELLVIVHGGETFLSELVDLVVEARQAKPDGLASHRPAQRLDVGHP